MEKLRLNLEGLSIRSRITSWCSEPWTSTHSFMNFFFLWLYWELSLGPGFTQARQVFYLWALCPAHAVLFNLRQCFIKLLRQALNLWYSCFSHLSRGYCRPAFCYCLNYFFWTSDIPLFYIKVIESYSSFFGRYKMEEKNPFSPLREVP